MVLNRTYRGTTLQVEGPNFPSIYGAMLAGVDYILMGAGIPKHIPDLIDRLTRHGSTTIPIDVDGAETGEYSFTLDPQQVRALWTGSIH